MISNSTNGFRREQKMSHLKLRWLALAPLLAGLSGDLYAVDGVVLIDQNRALAGGVTPGDAPGFPVTISLAGSYRLTGNLTVPDANTTAILITHDNVTIDLNGFSILGPTVCTGKAFTLCSPIGPGDGVDGGSVKKVTVVNGTVHGMGNIGTLLQAGSVRNVQADNNGAAGIFVSTGTVSGNICISNGGSGILVNNATVSGNTAIGNASRGIEASCPSSIVGNTAYQNGIENIGVAGIFANCALANNAAP